MTEAQKKTRKMFKEVKTITFILGGFGLVGIAFQAIIGKVKWVWFSGLTVDLAILGAAGAIVEYATGTNAGLDTSFGTGSVQKYEALANDRPVATEKLHEETPQKYRY